MLQLALLRCTPEELRLMPDHPEAALNEHLESSKIQEGFLPYKDADGLVYYFGKKPTFSIPAVDLKVTVYPDLVGLGHVKRRLMVLVLPALTAYTKMQLEKQKKQQQQQQELEAANDA
ncbi:hypothetical protein B0H17DRAFT_1209464 [Mycena rosella]|uniref:Uncharacterized protein n=1 Tax=Mycena rosella TaxID=1033263 RepID=A0AAD7CYD2_MYCRO|nr:hypothetical protein B0H17DRAFT_1209464 [Mycena rosella]